MECIRPVMTELNGFFIRPDNYLKIFMMTLPEIYQEHLCEKCAPHAVSHKAKYALHTPHISMRKFSDLNNPNSKINEITQEPFKEE